MPAPANDNFASRTTISGASGSDGPIDITLATTEVGEHWYGGGDDHVNIPQTIWYEWTAPARGIVNFTATGSVAGINPQVSVFTGSTMGTLVDLASIWTGSIANPLSFEAVAGTTYQIQVGNVTGGSPSVAGSITLSWSTPTPPANDAFASAIAITTVPDSTTGTTLHASDEVGEPALLFFSGPLQSVWYSFAPASSDDYYFKALASGFGLSLEFFTGSSVGALTRVTPSSGDGNPWAVYALTSGTTYHVRVATIVDPLADYFNTSSFTLSWKIPTTAGSAPPYDNIADAFPLIQDNASHSKFFDPFGSTTETNESTYGEGFAGVWAKIDLSNTTDYPAATPVSTTIAGNATGDVTPYIDTFKVIDASFDPATPDFSKLGFEGSSLGDGTASPSTSFSFTPNDSATGIFYLWIGDWNYDPYATGGETITYTIPGAAVPPPPPPDVINDSCASAIALVGTSGHVDAENTAWAGTWPTGDDPLWNVFVTKRGGGAPMWWKWTNPFAVRSDFKLTYTAVASVDGGIDMNAGLAVGACGSLDMNDFVPDVDSLTDTTYEWDLSDTELLDLVVGPGETIYIEFDSYVSGSVTEPPTADSAHRGKFGFDWSASSVTFYDGIPSSDLLHDAFSPILDPTGNPTGQVFPIELVKFNNRLYFTWDVIETDGQSLYVGDCALDGSDLNTTLLSDGAASGPYGGLGTALEGGKAQLVTDGVDLFVGYGYGAGGGTQYNPDGPGPATAGDLGVFSVESCDEVAVVEHHYRLHRLSSGSWPVFFDIGADNLTTGGGFHSGLGGLDLADGAAWLNVRMCASAAQPGTLWVHANYAVTRDYQSYHFNNYPLSSSPPGSAWCTSDLVQVEEFNVTFEVNVAGASITKSETLVASSVLHQWDHDEPNIDPVFAPWQFFTDGPWGDDSGFASAGYDRFWIVNDDGYPIIAYNPRETINPSTYANTVAFKRLDTGAVIGAYSYSDFTAGSHADTGAYISTSAPDYGNLFLTPRFFNEESGRYERGIATNWVASFPIWVNRIVSDCSAAPIPLIDGVPSSSSRSVGIGAGETLVKDGVRNWWVVAPALRTSWIDYYERFCNHSWLGGYSSNDLHGDHLGATYALSSKSYFDLSTSSFYFINGHNQIRRANIARDYYICAVGDTLVLAGLHVNWRN